MGDKYRNYAELSGNEKEGADYRICITDRQSPISIVAPHCGTIEPRTARIATAIAAESYNLYCFVGLKRGGFKSLHIKSTNFDEPKCERLIKRSELVITVHGLADNSKYVDLGGLNESVRKAMSLYLREAKFEAKVVTTGDHAGVELRNICNKGKHGGVQLEITDGLRRSLVTPGRHVGLLAFVKAIRQAIDSSVESFRKGRQAKP